jgi:hypothetical protein
MLRLITDLIKAATLDKQATLAQREAEARATQSIARYTAVAAVAAVLSALAAMASGVVLWNQVAIMQNDKRPYVGVTIQIPTFEIGKSIAPQVLVTNSGQSPALNLRGQIVGELLAPNSPAPSPPDEIVDMGQNVGILMPNANVFQPAAVDRKFQDQSEIDSIKSGRRVPWIYGRVEYEDVYQNHHWLKYSASFDAKASVYVYRQMITDD